MVFIRVFSFFILLLPLLFSSQAIPSPFVVGYEFTVDQGSTLYEFMKLKGKTSYRLSGSVIESNGEEVFVVEPISGHSKEVLILSKSQLDHYLLGCRPQARQFKDLKDLKAQQKVFEEITNGMHNMDCGAKENQNDAFTCQVCACYFESRGDGLLGRIQTFENIVSRKNHPNWPNSVCGVVWDIRKKTITKKDGTKKAINVGQYSFTTDNKPDIMAERKGLSDCVTTVSRQKDFSEVKFTHYHVREMNPYPDWASPNNPDCERVGSMQMDFKGAHVYYKCKR